MIKLKQCSKTFGDATALYEVELSQKYTVGYLIDEILNRVECGRIGIADKGQSWCETGNPSCEYKYGKLLTTFPDDVLNSAVKDVKANGGWGMMDYIITI